MHLHFTPLGFSIQYSCSSTVGGLSFECLRLLFHDCLRLEPSSTSSSWESAPRRDCPPGFGSHLMSLSVLDDSQWFSATSIALGNSVQENASSSVILDPLANEHYQLMISNLLKLQPTGDLDIFRFGSRWVLYVDLVGTIRSLFEREKFYLIELDDGTGCVTCTVWRQSDGNRTGPPWSFGGRTISAEYKRACEHLLSLACSGQPNVSTKDQTSSLHIGISIHLRGRVKRFRGQLKVNASFCRILSDSREELSEIVHRSRLKREIYQHPYDPVKICELVLKSLASSGAQLTVEEACRILAEDALHTFTRLDLCLNSRLADRLTVNSNPVAFDPFDVVPDWPSGDTTEARDLKSLVDELLKCLLSEGWIYPASEPIGGRVAYHSLSGDTQVEEAVFTAIQSITNRNLEEQGASIRAILNFVRCSKRGDWFRFSLPALRRVLDKLEGKSRIFQVQPSVYKIA